jgi:hypothetical protein
MLHHKNLLQNEDHILIKVKDKMVNLIFYIIFQLFYD